MLKINMTPEFNTILKQVWDLVSQFILRQNHEIKTTGEFVVSCEALWNPHANGF